MNPQISSQEAMVNRLIKNGDAKRRVSVLDLEQFLLNELEPKDRVWVEAQVSRSPALQSRLEEMRREDAEFKGWAHAGYEQNSCPPGWRERIATNLRAITVALTWPRGVASAVSLGLVGVISWLGVERSEVRLKGSGPAPLSVYQQDGLEVRAVAPGAILPGGTILQLGVQSGEAKYIAIVSLDSLGQVTQHLPSKGEWAVESVSGVETFLPHSYELDHVSEFEKFFLIRSANPFSLEKFISDVMKRAKIEGETVLQIDGQELKVMQLTINKKSSKGRR